MLYQVNYDLIKYKDYPKLWEALEELGARRVLLSTWVLKTTSTASEVRAYLRQFIDADDRLLVTKMTSDWAGRNLLIRLSEF
jgi:hypothetical protein